MIEATKEIGWTVIVLAWTLGVLTGLVLSRLQVLPQFLHRFAIASKYHRTLGYSWGLAWLKAGHVVRGEWL